MANIKVTIDTTEVEKALLALTMRVPFLALAPMKKVGIFIAGRSQKEYLRGPRPIRLRVDTSRLRGSIDSEAHLEGKNIITTVGTNVKSDSGYNYPGRWEFGKNSRPFLQPAREDHRDKWFNIFWKDFKKNLDKWLKSRYNKKI